MTAITSISVSSSTGSAGSRLLLLGHAAELVVIDQFRDGRMVAAHRALGITAQLEFAEAHGQGVIQHQAAHQRFADAQDQLHGFGGLYQTDECRAECPARRLRRSSEPGPEVAVQDTGSGSRGRRG